MKTRYGKPLREGRPTCARTARIVRAVQRDQRQLILPPLVRLLPVLRILPVGAFSWIASFLGVNASMDEFEGRGPR